MTIAVPFALLASGRYAVSVGMSFASFPSAPGAPFDQRGISARSSPRAPAKKPIVRIAITRNLISPPFSQELEQQRLDLHVQVGIGIADPRNSTGGIERPIQRLAALV